MNKTELVAAIAEKTDLTKKDAELALTAIVESITEALVKGDKVQLIGEVYKFPIDHIIFFKAESA